tara:strand:- start:7281 stop:7589 length:309 start_codon:yes stop_codon:yes gene_type:complete
LKSSLSSFDISAAIKSPNAFVTNKISFKYIAAENTGVVFSLSTRLGSAVERNLFKRRARQFILQRIDNNVAVFIRPKKQLKTIKNPIKHFKLFQRFLNKNQI